MTAARAVAAWRWRSARAGGWGWTGPAVLRAGQPRRVDLPTYAFQRQRFWPRPPGGRGIGGGGAGRRRVIRCWGRRWSVAGSGRFGADRAAVGGGEPWLADHVVGRVVVPGTAFVELALAAVERAGAARGGGAGAGGAAGAAGRRRGGGAGGAGPADEVGPAAAGERAHAPMTPCPAGGWTRSRQRDAGPGRRAGRGRRPAGGGWRPGGVAAGGWRVVALEGFYERLAAAGLGYGPAFQGLRAVWRRGEEVFAEVALPEGAAAVEGLGLHPALLDAALHAAAAGPARAAARWSCRFHGRGWCCTRPGRRGAGAAGAAARRARGWPAAG